MLQMNLLPPPQSVLKIPRLKASAVTIVHQEIVCSVLNNVNHEET